MLERCAAAGFTAVPFTVPATGGSFIFVSQPADFATAVADCGGRGGWLASYDSFKEQSALEAWLVDSVGGAGPACLPACCLEGSCFGGAERCGMPSCWPSE